MNNVELEYVGFWPRVGASLIDTALILVATLPLLFILYGKDDFQRGSIPQGPANVIISWVLPALAVIFFWVVKQATPGKIAIGAKIVDAKSGNAATVAQLVGRYFAYFISILPFCLGIFWVALDSRKQGWHDKLAGTVVVRPKHQQTEKVVFQANVQKP